jgi:hypothetical protein
MRIFAISNVENLPTFHPSRDQAIAAASVQAVS